MGPVRSLNLGGKAVLILRIATLLTVFGLIPARFAVSDARGGAIPLPNFEAVDLDGSPIELGDFDGVALILHITNIETPLCMECEEALKAQVEELSRLKEENPEAAIVTVNMRKNPYSKDGRSLSESWWGVDISWPWIEDFDPFPVAGKYIDYWSRGSGFANPTLILVNDQGQISRVYHVYQIGVGMVEGVQTAETLQNAFSFLQNPDDDGGPMGVVGSATAQEVTFIGMFGLGIVTSLAPCSLALMIAVFSYLMTSHRRKILMPDEGKSSPKEGLLIGVAFTLGMAMVFFVIGLFISNLGIFVRDSRSFDLAAGVLMIILGITSFKPLSEILEPLTSRLHRRRSVEPEYVRSKKSFMEQFINISVGLFKYSAFVGAFVLGVFFALGWAPCAVSLVFPVLIWLMAQNVTPITGGMMLFVFGLGHGVPIIPISTFSRSFCGAIGERYIALGKWITGGFGILIIATGVVFAARYFGYAFW
ncbi:MAG: cytochrome c biogenesis protein CcdA [Methanothrix sp.]|nr:cytochrome c biogenesis protein CcdA [Methanothrix sp.]